MNRRQFFATAIGAIVGFAIFQLRPTPEYEHHVRIFDGDSQYLYIDGKIQPPRGVAVAHWPAWTTLPAEGNTVESFVIDEVHTLSERRNNGLRRQG